MYNTHWKRRSLGKQMALETSIAMGALYWHGHGHGHGHGRHLNILKLFSTAPFVCIIHVDIYITTIYHVLEEIRHLLLNISAH